MGLASGPLVAALVVGQGEFGIIINLATIGLLACAIFSFLPARRSELNAVDILKEG
jgi:hypothetical protein